MSLHIFNSINKSWAMYTHTISSISGDHLTIKPHDGKNITFEVSGNNSVFIKRGDVSHNLSNLMAGLGGSGGGSTIGSGSDASLSNIDVSRNLNPLIVNGSSIGLATKNWGNAYVNTIYAETLNTYRGDKTLSLNSGTLLISGELLAQSTLNPLLTNRSSLGVSTNTWSNAYIRDLSAGSIEVSGNILPLRDLSSNIGTSLRRLSTLAVDDLSINKINGAVYSASGPTIVLSSVSGDIIPVSSNLFKLGDVSRNWSNAYLIDVSVSSIDISLNLNPLLANRSSLGLPSKLWGNAYLRDASISSIDVSQNLNPLNANSSSLGLSTRRWGNAYIRDVSVSIIDVSLNLNPLLNNGSSLGVPGKNWGNAYIRDVSVSSIDVSSNLNPFAVGSAVTVTQGTGGTVSISGGYIIHSFTTTGTSAFVPAFSGSVEVLIVGGGGGGGPSLGGGGGGGGVIWIPATNVTSGTSYNVVVGAGGGSQTNGQQSTAFTAIAAGGGSGNPFPTGNGNPGGSGGGASANTYNGTLNQGGITSGNSLGTNTGFIYGCSGGNMIAIRTADPIRGAGGGGAGGQGLDTNPNILGDTGQTGMGSGGVGVVNAILGPSYYWAGGGGGCGGTSQTGGYGGFGGGGGGTGNSGMGIGGINGLTNGSTATSSAGGAGGANTGGGGGGANWGIAGGAGGSGIVVIRYLQSIGAPNTSSLGLSTRRWGNAYIRDISVSSIDVSINSINPFLNNGSSLGLISKLWRNAYFRDLSAGNIDVSTSIIPFAVGSGGGTALSATGGTVTISGAYTIHSFTTTGTSAFVPAFNGSVEVLIVGGGGGGGSNLGGGGGAGGVIWIPATNVISGTSYPVVVGTGGPSGTSGLASSVFGATAAGGGTSGSWPSGSGTAGGSGGGAPANDGAINQGGGTSGNSLGTNNGTANVGTIYGNRGGHMTTGRTSGPTRAAGGGGAGGQGLDTNSNTTGDTGRTGMGSGGVGVVNAILGPSHYWGGGGGGASWDNQIGGYGGLGGGGGGGGAGSPTIGVGLGGGSALNSGANGSLNMNTTGGAGGANTGGGGGGGNHSTGLGGTGGSGIVVIRYLTSSGSGSTANSSLGLSTKYWGNAYIRDVSASAIELSGNIIPSINNTLSLGSSLRRWNRVFVDNLNVSTINGAAYTSGGGGGVFSITSDMIPSITNTYDLGSTSCYWNNAYINNLRASNRVYQEISGDISWSAVNGHYGLAKDAYPGLNPLSSGDLAVRTWIPRLTEPTWTTGTGLSQLQWSSVCWSPYLGLFTSLASGTDGSTIYKSMWSVDGEHWNDSQGVDYNNTLFTSICWSQEKYMFVAVANSGDRRLAYSYNGKKWFQWFNQAIIPLPTNNWSSICWSQELRIFVAVADDGGTNRVATGGATGGETGIENWTTYVPVSENNRWTSVCWSAELRLFVAVAREGTNRVMTSRTGHSWSLVLVSTPSTWSSICWSKELGIFVAVATSGSFNVMTSNNGINWTAISSGIDSSWNSVCWSGELEVFVAVAGNGTNRVMSSSNGITWTARTAAQANNWRSICWSPELGLFVAVSTNGSNRSMRTSLKSRPPTSYNVFNREFITNITFGFNSIDETGKWTFQSIYSPTMTVQSANVNSDDRLKHNEVVITNGLDVIDRLNPKFYKKTLTLLDASYNGDLSGQSWSYEAGLIAQEVLQIPDLSFAVSGGDYYQETINYYDISYILRNQSNDPSTNYYDPSTNHIISSNYDISANYDISYNLIKQPYSLNYNSVFTYGIAAIKELHAKVKIQETTNLDEQLNSLIERIEAL